MLPEMLYSYSTNFNRKPKATTRPYKPSFKVKLLDLLRPDWHYIIPSLERRIAILQHLMNTAAPFYKGSMYNGLSCLTPNYYRCSNKIDFNESAYKMSEQIQKRITELLLRVDVDMDVIKWRIATGLLDVNQEITIPVKTYRHRAAMPIKAFESLEDKVNGLLKMNKLTWSPNSSHNDAMVFKNSGFGIGTGKNAFYFVISYTTPDHPHGGWEVNIRSNEGETFVDFVLRLYSVKETIFSTGECLEADGMYSPYYFLKNGDNGNQPL